MCFFFLLSLYRSFSRLVLYRCFFVASCLRTCSLSRCDDDKDEKARMNRNKRVTRNRSCFFDAFSFSPFFSSTTTKTDYHRVPQAGHDGRAPAQHPLGAVVHPRPSSEFDFFFYGRWEEDTKKNIFSSFFLPLFLNSKKKIIKGLWRL